MKHDLFTRVSTAIAGRGFYRVFYTLCLLGVVAFLTAVFTVATWLVSFDDSMAWEVMAYACRWAAGLTPYVTALLLVYLACKRMPGETDFGADRPADTVLGCVIVIGTSLGINGVAHAFAAKASVVLALPGTYALVVIPLAIMGVVVSIVTTLYFRDRNAVSSSR